MTLFSKKRRPSALERELDRPAKRSDLQEPMRSDDNSLGDFEPAPRQQPMQQRRQMIAEPDYPEPPRLQSTIASRSITESNYEIILSKIDVIDAKLDGVSRRLEMLERLLQALQQTPTGQDNTQYKGYQRRVW